VTEGNELVHNSLKEKRIMAHEADIDMTEMSECAEMS